MTELTPGEGYPEAAKERRSSSFSDAQLEKVFCVYNIRSSILKIKFKVGTKHE